MLRQLDATSLRALVDSAARESAELDFKSDYDADNPEHRRGLIDDVCALANARGGWLLLGVTETAGAATGLPGLEVTDKDAFRRRLIQMIENGLEPRLTGMLIEFVPISDERHVVGIRVPQSWTGPHRTTSGRRFMVRGDGGNTEYDIHGLRQAFVARDHATRAWEAFCDDRIARFYAERLPLVVRSGPAALIHLYPLRALDTSTSIDLTAAAVAPALAPSEDLNDGHEALPNLDGIVRRGCEYDGAWRHYVQVFRGGALESFLSLVPQGGSLGVALPWLQEAAHELLPRWVGGLADLDVTGPFQFSVTLVGVRGLRPLEGKRAQCWGNEAREDTLALPPWAVNPTDPGMPGIDAVLGQLRVLLHNAFGRDGINSRHF